ncbi:hypothetical protein FC093_08355 [Ilyomonas limi]|uniref:Signal transduction histidine kinase internal region domain-containing protein n=1 Tax=Ilyomonas limi TaxID=2575867 RepID=A0A4U3L6R8_9BACT|nr:histidine kinase [Ilyomonas limi]TKK69317.1 hypothetical protein FC093_08355 [Ilyomonas limi]
MVAVTKKMFSLLMLMLLENFIHAQYSDAEVFKQMNPSTKKNAAVDNLKRDLLSSKEDTSKALQLLNISNIYMWSFPDSALVYALKGLRLSEKLHFTRGSIKAYHSMGEALAIKEAYPKALEVEFKALHLSQDLNDQLQISLTLFWIGIIYLHSENPQQALDYLHRLAPDSELYLKNKELILAHLGFCYFGLNKLDSALFYMEKSCDLEIRENNGWCLPFIWRGQIEDKSGRYDNALKYYRMGISIAAAKRDLFQAYNSLALTFIKLNLRDSSVFYLKKTIDGAQNEPFFSEIITASKLLVDIYTSLHMIDSAFKYQELTLKVSDSLFNQEKINRTQNLSFIDQLRQQQEANNEQQFQSKIRIIILVTTLLVFLIIGTILWRNNMQKQEANILLQQQKLKVETTLQQLESTQAQLIQTEKEKLFAQHIKEVHELEAKALRAQMNPHFIFNCMNSIKALIQKNEQEKSILYLTTFSKLIRTVFQNSDKREISLYDEMETCRLYAQLESMRFNNKFSYAFNIDKTLDLKSIMVPALIVQPYIENAIWHGIMPKENGGMVMVTVDRTDGTIRCTIDDDGIGREMSKQNKFLTKDSTHESKGVYLTQARLHLDNLLNERNARVTIIDKKDEHDQFCGTTVILCFDEY